MLASFKQGRKETEEKAGIVTFQRFQGRFMMGYETLDDYR